MSVCRSIKRFPDYTKSRTPSQDKNANGVNEPGEFLSLAARGIKSISLTSDNAQRTMQGNTIFGMGSYTRLDGSTGQLADVRLRVTTEVYNPATSADTITGTSGNDTIHSGSGNDKINAGDGNDVVYAGSGDDNLFGSAGNDDLYGDSGRDVIFGGDGNDTGHGGYGNDTVSGGAGNDNLFGEQGDDFISGDAGDDMLSGDTGNDVLSGGDGNDTLHGGDGVNVLYGNSGDDKLYGDSGSNAMHGGTGNDTYFVNGTGDQAIEQANEGIDTVVATLDYTLGGNIENLTLAGTATKGNGNTLNNFVTGNELDNILSGNAGNDSLVGGAGDDSLDGGSGADTMSGGKGNDVYVVDSNSDIVMELAAEGIDTVRSEIDYTLGENLENAVLTGTAVKASGNALDNVITGNDLGNVLSGYAGNDTINGGAGADTIDGGSGIDVMAGGKGNDIYVIDDTADTVSELAGEGIDTVLASASYTLSANVENLTLTGTGNINGAGNALDNLITGNTGNNVLNGAAGNDTVLAGAGNDTVSGGDGNDSLTGGLGDDVYVYQLGDGLDSIADAGGNDTLQLGAGFTLDNVALRLTTVNGVTTAHVRMLDDEGCEQPTQGFDFVMGKDSSGKLVSPIDAFQFADGSKKTWTDLQINVQVTKGVHGVSSITTGRNDDIITAGSNKNNVIHSGTGNDTVYAFNQDDTVFVEGGDDLAIGGVGNDTIDGGCGTDILSGSKGNDSITDTGDDGNNALFGGFGDDTITAGANADFIAGGYGNDTIYAGAGANVIAVNRKDDIDTIFSAEASSNTLSLGGGISNADLAFRKDGNDLMLETGKKDQVVFKDWYADAKNRTFVNLQVIEDASNDYSASSTDKLRNKRIEEFDFKKLVAQFDAARSSTPSLSRWAVMNGMLEAHLGGSDTAAIGGDLAYQYGTQTGSGKYGVASVQDTLKQAGFGSQAQTVHTDLKGMADDFRILS